ncbi:MAG: hypothetical protein IT436_08590 [Phycisphaerales bacterium]|nr:hypothetical protein [Phycisphaerales bacterium]
MGVIRSVLAPLVLMCLSAAPGCAGGLNNELSLSAESLQQRQLQTRKFETRDEGRLLTAAVGLVQDLGFSIDNTQPRLGLIVGSKERSTSSSALVKLGLGSENRQRIRICVVTHPVPGACALRVTFQRVVMDPTGVVLSQEFIDDPKVYEEFFAKMSKAVFLEAQQI